MTAETDLLPYPFCGGRPKTKSTFVRCTECGGQMCFGETEELDSVIAAWNTRANLAELQREVEGLRAEVALLRTGAENERLHQSVLLGRARDRAERLAGALRAAEALAVVCMAVDGYSRREVRDLAEGTMPTFRAALDQETTNG